MAETQHGKDHQAQGKDHPAAEPDPRHTKDKSTPPAGDSGPKPQMQSIGEGLASVDADIVASRGGPPGSGLTSLLRLMAAQFMGVQHVEPPPPPAEQQTPSATTAHAGSPQHAQH